MVLLIFENKKGKVIQLAEWNINNSYFVLTNEISLGLWMSIILQPIIYGAQFYLKHINFHMLSYFITLWLYLKQQSSYPVWTWNSEYEDIFKTKCIF